MAADAIYFSTPTKKIPEGSGMIVIARFREKATNAEITPTTVDYRIDTDQGREITGWTSVATAPASSIVLEGSQNPILNDFRVLETRLLTVAADRGLTTEYRDTMQFQVRNEPYAISP